MFPSQQHHGHPGVPGLRGQQHHWPQQQAHPPQHQRQQQQQLAAAQAQQQHDGWPPYGTAPAADLHQQGVDYGYYGLDPSSRQQQQRAR